MAQTKTADKKRSSKTGSKAAEAKAKKALTRAEKSVKKAQKAVKASSKKLQAKAADLAKTAEKLTAKHAGAARELQSAKAAVAVTEPAAVLVTPPLPTAEPATPTLVELRGRAKDLGVAGYSRMNKAALIEALESAPTR